MSVRKVPGKTEGSLEGNHDNPVSGTHQAPSYWEPQWRNAQILTKNTSKGEGTGGWGQKQLSKATAHEGNISKIIDF